MLPEEMDYRQYCISVSNKISKQFKADFYKEIKTLSNWSDDDISDSLVELKQAHFIKMNIIGGFIIEDALIIQMENRFKSSLSEITKYIADLVADTAVGLIL